MLLKLAAISYKLWFLATPAATLCCQIRAETVTAASRTTAGLSTHCSTASQLRQLEPTAWPPPQALAVPPLPDQSPAHALIMSFKTLHHSEPSTQQSPTQSALPHLSGLSRSIMDLHLCPATPHSEPHLLELLREPLSALLDTP